MPLIIDNRNIDIEYVIYEEGSSSIFRAEAFTQNATLSAIATSAQATQQLIDTTALHLLHTTTINSDWIKSLGARLGLQSFYLGVELVEPVVYTFYGSLIFPDMKFYKASDSIHKPPTSVYRGILKKIVPFIESL